MAFIDPELLAQTLVHSLWQAGVVCVLVWFLLSSTSERFTAFRYWSATLGLLVIFLVSTSTYSWLEHQEAQTSIGHEVTPYTPPTVTNVASDTRPPFENLATTRTPPTRSTLLLESPGWENTLCTVWSLGVAFMFVRMVRNLRATNRFVGECRPETHGAVVETLLALEKRMKLRQHVRVLVQDSILQPAALGILKPAIVLPIHALTGLDEIQLKAVLAHELAHIKRHDYIVNLAQSVIEVIYFFNPFVWVLNRIIRMEREAGCDRTAAEVLGNTGDYARALLDSVDFFGNGFVAGANALGAERSTRFSDRVRRLIKPNDNHQFRMRWTGLAGAMVVAAGIASSLTYTTHRTVIVTAEILTPEQRVALVEKVEADANARAQGPFKIEGYLTDEDGVPFSGKASVWYSGEYSSCIQYGLFTDGILKITPSESLPDDIGIVIEGYGPLHFQPHPDIRMGDTIRLDSVLKKPIDNVVRIQNKQGDLLGNVEIRATYRLTETFSVQGKDYIVSDSAGTIDVTGGSGYPIQLTVAKPYPGFQSDEIEIRLEPGKSHDWILSTANTVRGVLRDALTKAPIGNAEIKHLHERGLIGKRNSMHGPNSRQLLAITNADGSFEITTFSPNTRNSLEIVEDGYAPKFVLGVFEDSDDLVIELEAPRVLKGRFENSGEKIPSRVTIVAYIITDQGTFEGESATSSYGTHRTARVVDGKFEFPNLFPGEWTIRGSDWFPDRKVDLENSITEVVLGANSPTAPGWMTLELTITGGSDQPLPEGEILVTPFETERKERATHFHGGQARIFKVTTGQVTIEIPDDCDGFYVNTDVRQARFEANAPGFLGLPGFNLPEQRIMRGSNREFSSELNLRCIPSGSVTVQLFDADGAPYGKAEHISRYRLAGYSHNGPKVDTKKIGKNSVLVSSIPLDDPFRLIASYRGSYLISSVITLTAEKPVIDLGLHATVPESLIVEVADTDGNPVSGAQLSLSYRIKTHGFSTNAGVTDSDGVLQIESIQLNPSAEIKISVKPVNENMDYQRFPINSFDEPLRIVLKERDE